MPAQCTFKDLLLTARTRMSHPDDQQEVYKLCRTVNESGLLQIGINERCFGLVAHLVNPLLAEKLDEASTISEAVDAFFMAAETDYASDADQMTTDHAVLYLFDLMARGLITGHTENGVGFGHFYIQMMSRRLGEQLDKLPPSRADEVPLMALEAERLEAMQRRLVPERGIFAYFPQTWRQVEAIRNLASLKRLFAAGINNRLLRALGGYNATDRKILRSDSEFFALLDQIQTRMEMRGLKLDELADAFRQAYGLPPKTRVEFNPGLGSIHLHRGNHVITTFGQRAPRLGSAFLLQL